MSDGPTDDPPSSSVGDALANLQVAMRRATGGTNDPDRRRAAVTLSELMRTDDADLARFAARHLPGRDVGVQAVKELRDLVQGVARLVALQGKAPDARDLVGSLRSTLSARLAELEKPSGSSTDPSRVASPSRDVALPIPRPIGPSAVQALEAMEAPGPLASPEPSVGTGVFAGAAPAIVQAPAPVIGATAMEGPRQTPPRAMPSYLHAPAASPWAPTGYPLPATPAHEPMLGAQPPMMPPAAQPAFVAAPAIQEAPPSPSRFDIVDEGTAMADDSVISALDPEASLPFARSPSSARQPVQHVDDDDSADGGRTGAYTYGEHVHAVEPAPVSAGVRSLPVHLAMIDLESHATMTAMLQAYPERSADICARYGLTDAAERELLDEFWFSRFRRFPNEREEWARLRDHALSHYRSSR